MGAHRHRAVSRKTYGWTRCVARPGVGCDGRSHGGVTHVDTCQCGATRRTETNGCDSDSGSWEMPINPPTNK